ncbi:MAG TPA: cytochrome c [Bryobacteraceae bacterium]|nr:cytochrome c [Bryobacteraceae bacterium]
MTALWMVASSMLSAAAATPTFHKDIEPLFQKHCQSCHRPGEAAPMSLIRYQDAKPWAKAIREAVLQRRMPPWHADPNVGRLANARTLDESEIHTIRDWVDAGAPKGSPKDAPKPRRFVDGWTIAKPDLVLELPVEYEVPASGPIDYVHFAVPTHFTEDRWVQQVEVRPGLRSLVHHIGVDIRPKGSKWLPQVQPGAGTLLKERVSTRETGNEHIAMYLPGSAGEVLPEGSARLISAGSQLIFQVHYQPNGKPGRDRSRVGLVFAKTPVEKRIHTVSVGNADFVIPPGNPDLRVVGSFLLFRPVTILSVVPHMHLRGKSFRCWVDFPDKTRVHLVRVPNYNRLWQAKYQLADPLQAPAKSWIQCLAAFDNSANNPWNPDPKAEVRWGDQTTDEMMVGYIDVAFPAEWPLTDFYKLSK